MSRENNDPYRRGALPHTAQAVESASGDAGVEMSIFDCQAHWSTEIGYVFQDEEEKARQQRIWGTTAQVESEEEMVAAFRRNRVRAVMSLGFTIWMNDIGKIRQLHDYVFAAGRRYPDAIFGHWLSFNPALRRDALREFRRALDADAGFVGLAVIGQQPARVPASDERWDPFYRLSIEAGVPVLIYTGLTGVGQDHPGGKGIVLDDGHPRHIDIVAARYPSLKILAARPAYPWQDEMIAVMRHKSNVHCELHGWSPRAFTPALKKEIGGRLQDRFMFGSDYPVLKHEMLADRWRSLGLAEPVLEKVFHRNAEAYFPGAKNIPASEDLT